MNKKLPTLILTGALACAMALPALAAEAAPVPISAVLPAGAAQTLPHSVLYYGTVKELVKREDGSISRLHMTSDRYGEYIMNVSAQTVWIDSGNHKAGDPDDLREGQSLYVFRSAAETRSLPPQSTALAVVWNIPMDAGTAQLHQVEAVSLENGRLKITTDQGGLYLLADKDTSLSFYGSEGAAALEDIQAGDQVMAWYGAVATSYPGQAYATHLMLLPEADAEPLTRGELVQMMYEQAGSPSVHFITDYTDVAQEAEYAQAVSWAAREGLVSGYGNGTFGPEDPVSREQLVTILWHYAGSPILADYPGLSQFRDAGDISLFAQPAFAWAHQKGYLSAVEGDILAPQNAASRALTDTILAAFAQQ